MNEEEKIREEERDEGEMPGGDREPAEREEEERPEEPDEETLCAMLETLRDRYPRIDAREMIAARGFRDFGERSGWSLQTMQEQLPERLEEARALMRAAEPPVSRATGGSPAHRRSLLTAHQAQELREWNRANPQYRMTELEYHQALKR